MLTPTPQMKAATSARQSKKVADSFKPQTAGVVTHSTPADDTNATPLGALQRLLLSRLEQLGLPSHTLDGESFLIAGQAFDLRSATAYARRLGRAGA